MTCSLFSDIIIKHCFQELNDKQSKIVHETLARQIQVTVWVSLIKKFISRRVFFVSEITTKHTFQELDDEQSKIVRETLERQVQAYMRFCNISTTEGVSGLIEHIHQTYNLALKSVGLGCIEMSLQCPSLESLERLWSDYQSGHLNDVAERYLVTDDIKKKLNLKNVRLKTTIEGENYRICKMILMEEPCEFGSLM